jgi:hypothetical protein
LNSQGRGPGALPEDTEGPGTRALLDRFDPVSDQYMNKYCCFIIHELNIN